MHRGGREERDSGGTRNPDSLFPVMDDGLQIKEEARGRVISAGLL